MDKNSAIAGILYIVATPIGNLADLSERACNTLKAVDFILAEDTRHSAHLLRHIGISKPVYAFHAFNEKNKGEQILSRLQQGESCALISDAGTPLICDPGFELVRMARQYSISVVPVPGACALITALCAAGIACDSFLFDGFLPAKQEARQKRLQLLKALQHTLIVYESSHRIIACVEDIRQVYGEDFHFVLAKELTKTHERFVAGDSHDILDFLTASSAHVKGEFVLILPHQPAPQEHLETDRHLLTVLLDELPLKQAVKIAEKLSSSHKNALYQLALTIKASH